MKATNKFIYAICVICGLLSCEKSQDWTDNKDDYKAYKMGIEVSTDSLIFEEGESTKSFIVSSKCPWNITTEISGSSQYGDWTRGSSQYGNWISINNFSGKNEDKILVTVTENTSAAVSREAAIIVTDGLNTCKVYVKQDAASEMISVSPTSLSFDWSGGDKEVTIIRNVDYTVKSADTWCSFLSSNKVHVTANNSYQPRSTTLTLTGKSKTTTISVSQQAAPQPTVKATVNAGSVTKTSASCKVEYNSDAFDITQYGFCYSTTNKTPSIENNDGSMKNSPNYSSEKKNGSYTFTISGLKQNTTYYVCPYVTTAAGTTYGDAISFTTKKTNSPGEDDNPTPGY